MAASQHTQGLIYPSNYKEENMFQDEEILTAEHMNYIANNINAILRLLAWNQEIPELTQPAQVSGVIIQDRT